MKEKDMTPEVIKLSKEIAKYWRMEIEKFGWFSLDCDPSPFNLDNYTFWKEGGCIHQATHDLLAPNQVTVFKEDEWFPIPSISDCLEKLRELGHVNLTIDTDETESWVAIINPFHPKFEEARHDFVGKTLHEALLSALLEVLKK